MKKKKRSRLDVKFFKREKLFSSFTGSRVESKNYVFGSGSSAEDPSLAITQRKDVTAAT